MLRLALHLLSAEPGTVPDVAVALQRAATPALEHGAADTARRYLVRALREPVEPATRAELLHRLGAIALRQGDPVALAHLREALEATPPGRAAPTSPASRRWAWSPGAPTPRRSPSSSASSRISAMKTGSSRC